MTTLVLAIDYETTDNNKPKIINGKIRTGKEAGYPLEVAIVLSVLSEDVDGTFRFTQLLEERAYIHHEGVEVWQDAPQVVLDLHDRTGFRKQYDCFVGECQLNKFMANSSSASELDEYLALKVIDVIEQYRPGLYQKDKYPTGDINLVIPVGKNVQFDISYSNLWFPRLAMLFDYKAFDVSLMKNLLRMLGHKDLKALSKKPSTHHALDDCHSAIADMKVTLDVLKNKFPNDVVYLEDLLSLQEKEK